MNKLPGLMFVGLTLLGAVEAAPGWRLLHDPFSTVRQPMPDAAEQSLLTRAARLTGFSTLVKLQARVPGPFLKRGANETAYLYGNGNEQLALLVLRAGKPVLHVRLMNNEVGISAVKEAYAVRDINGDGLRELAVVQEFGDAGTYAAWLNVVDFRTGVPRVIQRFSSQDVHCELGTSTGKQRAYRIEVRSGPNPTYRATEFGQNNCVGQSLPRLRSGISPVLDRFTDLNLQPERLPLP